MFRVARKSVLGNKLRFALTALAVVVGVAFVAGVFVLTDSINRAFSGLFDDLNAAVSVYVNPVSDVDADITGSGLTGGPTLDESVLDTITAVDGVDRAAPFVQGFTAITDRDGELVGGGGPPTLGFSWTQDDANPLRIGDGDGRPPRAADEVVIDRGSAATAGFEVGDEVTLVFIDRAPQTFRIVGLSSFGDSDNLLGATTSAFTLERAQELFGLEGRLSQVAVVGEAGIDDVELRDRIAAVLDDPSIEVVTGEQQNDSDLAEIEEGLGFIATALLAFAGIALFVGSFIVVNTFSITVAQRTREFALLRAVGASAAQVRQAVMVEALIVGLLASVVGLGLGIGLAVALQGVLEASGVSLPSSGTVVLPRTYVAAFVIGVGVTLVASVLPARRAARIAPVEAMRGTGAADDRGMGRARTVGGGATALGGMALLLYGLLGGAAEPLPLVGSGALLTFVGVALLAPLLAGPTAAALGSLPARLGVPGRLARRNAQRSPKRTAATASALMIGVALVAFVSIFAASITRSVDVLFDEQFRADISVQADTGFGPPQPIPFAVRAALEDVEGIDRVASVQFSNLRVAGATDTSFVASTDPDTGDELFDLGIVTGDLLDLADGGVFVDDERADADGIAVGDVLVADFAAASGVELPVVGVFANEELVGAPFLVANDTMRRVAGALGDQFVSATLVDGADVEAVRERVEAALADFPSLAIQTTAEIREEAEQNVTTLLNFFIVLLLLAIVVAVIGIVNTLALSVFERTREIGLLRAVGMVRRQARAMIRWEAVIVAVFGAGLGIVVGAFFGWAMVRALADEGISELAFPAGRLVSYVVIAGLAGVVAAILPARRAARLDVLDAVTDE